MQSSTTVSKVAVVGNNWFPDNPGGLDRYVYELVHSLTGLNTQVDLFGIGLPSDSDHPAIQLKNLAQPELPLWQRLWSANQTFRTGRDRTPDAIHLHFALYGLPLLPHFPAGVPVTCTFHGPWAEESEREGSSKLGVLAKKWIEQAVYHRCDRFIVLSKAFGEILHQEYQVPWEKIHVIPGGVDIQRFQVNLTRQQARATLNWAPDRFILFTPRRLVQRMGLDKLLAAIAQIQPAVPDIWLAIAGKGPLRGTLEQQVQELGLSDHVKLLGFLPDEQLPIAYQAADLTIMPSQSLEGFGLVLVESLACGTPALCTPVGGMPEVVRGLSPELITATREVDSLADSLKSIVTGKQTLPTRDTCRDYACTHFNWTHIAQQVRDVLLN